MVSMATENSSSLAFALSHGLQAALPLSLSHLVCCCIILYFDLSGKWAKYAIHKSRDASLQDYLAGGKSFVADLILLFLPFISWCFWVRREAIEGSNDTILVSLAKLGTGYVLGKVVATGVHYMLHIPCLYHYHRQHHCNPKSMVASRAWQDSYVEYAVMELPSFALSLLLFPTHAYMHIIHFMWHGWDGACSHSGFSAPGLLGFLFDGEYHYHHHAHLTVNYAELEFLDKLFRTHHSQKKLKKTAA